MTSNVHDAEELKSRPSHRLLLANAELLSVPDEEDEANYDRSHTSVNPDRESSTNASVLINRPWLEVPPIIITPPKERPTAPSERSRSYRYVQLERNFQAAKLLRTYADRFRFHREYLQSIHENRFEEFLRKSYDQLQAHYDRLEQERLEQLARTFTFVDLEQRFLKQDPCRNIKIVFVDDPSGIKKIRSTTLMYQDNQTNQFTNNVDIESFYKNESQRLICDSPRARDEITLFARRAGERLQDSLPHLPRVPHRVTILDERDQNNPLDERVILQMKHQQALTVIHKRRQLLTKMVTQSKRNQMQMKRQTPRALATLVDHSNSCCRELLEQANQIDKPLQSRLSQQRTATCSKTSSYSETTLLSTNITPSYSSSSTLFTDTLPFYQMETSRTARFLLPTRPLTAPTKINP